VLCCAVLYLPADLRKGLFATEVGTMRSPETVAAVFERMQTLIANMRRYGFPTGVTATGLNL
jgi:hypothetical protein